MKKTLQKTAVLALLGLIIAVAVPEVRKPVHTPQGQALMGTLTANATAAKWVSINGLPTDPSGMEIFDRNPLAPRVGAKLPGFYLQQENLGATRCCRVSIPGQVLYQVAGMPEVPVISRSVEVPAGSKVILKTVSHETREYKLGPILPSTGHLLRDTDAFSVVPEFGPFYESDGIWPKVDAEVGETFSFGPYAGINVRYYPIRYDAGKGLVIVTEKLVLDLLVTPPVGAAKTITLEAGPRAEAMSTVYRRLFGTEPAAGALKYEAPLDRGRMLIITTDALATGLDDFVQWKRQLGIPVTTVTTSQIGATPADITQAIAAAYAEPEGLTWVILAGDHAEVPPHAGGFDGSDSDTRYAMLVGDDLYPDVFVSRVSAKNVTHLQTQLNKFIAYEKQPQNNAWYRRAVGIASNEGLPSDSQRADLLASALLGYGFDSVASIYEGLGGNSTVIRNTVNDGVSLINYLGHGEGTYWSSVYFGLDQVHALQNGPAWPWIVDVSCSNGDFALPECLAEAWLRAGTPEAPQGAVGMISASSLAPWIPPTVMQREVVDLVINENTFTLGGLYYSGLMKVVDTYTGEDVAEQVMDQNIIFGDCSLRVRTMEPGYFTVSGPADLPRADSVWEGHVAGPVGSLVTLVTEEGIVALAELDADGDITLDYATLPQSAGSVTLTVSGDNMAPYIQVLSLDGEDLTDPGGSSEGPLPTQVTLRGNYPNPFNPSTTIAFDLPREMSVRLSIFDIRGRLVRTLLDEGRPAGTSEVLWDGTSASGGPVASGMYLYRLETPDGAQTGRMTLSK